MTIPYLKNLKLIQKMNEKYNKKILEAMKINKGAKEMEKLLNAVNEEIKTLKESNIKLNQENLELQEDKKTLNNMLSVIPTKVLVKELEKRFGVNSAKLNKNPVFVSVLDDVYKIEDSDVLLVVRLSGVGIDS